MSVTDVLVTIVCRDEVHQFNYTKVHRFEFETQEQAEAAIGTLMDVAISGEQLKSKGL